MSLVELLVAVTLLTVMTGAVVVTVTGTFKITADNRKRSVAAGIVAQTLDGLRATAFTTVSTQEDGVHSWTTVDNNVTYTVTQQVKATPPPEATTDTCQFTSSGINEAFLSATVTVSWPQAGTAGAQGKTLLAPPAGIINSNDSGVVIQVVSGDGVSHPNALPISIAPSTQPAVPTDSNGCASFAFLTNPPSTYTFAPTGGTWLTPKQTPASVSTAPGQPTLIEQWDLAATLVASPLQTTGQLPTSCRVSGVACGWVHYPVTFVAAQPTGTNVVGSDSRPATAFPFYNSLAAPGRGYRAYVGDCTDSDPGASYGTPFTSVPGGSDTETVTTPGITVASPRAFTTLTAVDAGCNPAETYTWSVPSTTSATIALPTGSWTVTASNSGTNVATGTATITPASTAMSLT